MVIAVGSISGNSQLKFLTHTNNNNIKNDKPKKYATENLNEWIEKKTWLVVLAGWLLAYLVQCSVYEH